ncbi:UNVERIFIED_CONTAM: hypothetical protein K2H54_027150 [Gekko kuhli]
MRNSAVHIHSGVGSTEDAGPYFPVKKPFGNPHLLRKGKLRRRWDPLVPGEINAERTRIPESPFEVASFAPEVFFTTRGL